ncbi:cell wall assembly regulator SMI1 [Ereboglobus sp. PH5-5]|uniref:SMI1/KNR4 family protein n=1 Tax=Ereboglobus sp. PH5-5 TaxID=2940529 RepID=UPI0024076538|nr:SMI1/KNR4 family protein [Ereboglobus sp. PH5-5]MDF9833315.1 cell wall assembly regulator SMI1 [Ereboglobus sp. PH5-5]
MTPIDIIKNAQHAELTNEDGDKITIELSPPASPEQIKTLEDKIGQKLPDELRTILSFCSAIDGCLEQIDFTGHSLSFEFPEVFPNGLPIAADGFGNFWVLDITPQTKDSAPVFFACHDAPVILYQSPSISSFLIEVFRLFTAPHESLINDIHEDRLFEVWKRNPDVIEYADACASSDESICDFARTLNAKSKIVDLRNAKVGMGFSWGRYGPKTKLHRYKHEHIFAYEKPPSAGFLTKLFGR